MTFERGDVYLFLIFIKSRAVSSSAALVVPTFAAERSGQLRVPTPMECLVPYGNGVVTLWKRYGKPVERGPSVVEMVSETRRSGLRSRFFALPLLTSAPMTAKISPWAIEMIMRHQKDPRPGLYAFKRGGGWDLQVWPLCIPPWWRASQRIPQRPSQEHKPGTQTSSQSKTRDRIGANRTRKGLRKHFFAWHLFTPFAMRTSASPWNLLAAQFY